MVFFFLDFTMEKCLPLYRLRILLLFLHEATDNFFFHEKKVI